MLPQTVGAIVCLFLAQVAADTGVHFVMERHPDSYFCGHLQCVADFTKSDQDVSTFVEMTIYDITKVNSELKLASVSAFDPDLYVDTTKASAVSCTGIISRLQANLTLKLRHDIDCLYGVYKCQLDLFTESGHPEVLTEIVIPENIHNYSRVAEVISHIDELTGLFNIHTTLVSNQTTVINKLESHLVDVTSQLMNQTSQLDNMSQRHDLETTNHKEQHDAVEKRLMALDLKLDTIQQLSKYIADTSQDQDNQLKALQQDNQVLKTMLDSVILEQSRVEELLNSTPCSQDHQPLENVCYRDMPHKNDREKFLLNGKVLALCDTETDGGGWVVIQRRVRGDVDFYRRWDNYKRGFGTPDTDFWIGNDIIHNLTSQGYNQLRIDFVADGTDYFAQYTNFSVADESSNYRLTISGYSGNIYDSMAYHNGSSFSTPDRDNDLDTGSCSVSWNGSWWYNGCYHANLNGVWAAIGNTSIRWVNNTEYLRPLTFTEMKIRHI